MFPSGNIVRERSKFGENVPGWELFLSRRGPSTLNATIFRVFANMVTASSRWQSAG